MRFSSLLFALTTLLLTLSAQAESSANKSALQAAFTYNFASYTEWSTLSGESFNFCTWRAPLVLAALNELPPRQLKNLVVRYFEPQKIAELKTCQVVYVDESAQEDLAAIHGLLGSRAILIVTAQPDAATSPYATITLFENNQRFAFNINRSAAQTMQLKISAELLSLAKKIY
ncbi:MAG: YfiR family protein [Gallionella sp.]